MGPEGETPPVGMGAQVPPVATSEELEQIEADLAGVEQALARLEAGTYGTCEGCGSPLDDSILAATPTAVRCGACA